MPPSQTRITSTISTSLWISSFKDGHDDRGSQSKQGWGAQQIQKLGSVVCNPDLGYNWLVHIGWRVCCQNWTCDKSLKKIPVDCIWRLVGRIRPFGNDDAAGSQQSENKDDKLNLSEIWSKDTWSASRREPLAIQAQYNQWTCNYSNSTTRIPYLLE